ncbi:hypothetical protein [Tuanshanicoccus lijuaniae]|uniref:hypothetical protein n=1 Tax=Aerococcaceae bacterium zg-1292 TaxID=2774330 RepID=UPI001BD86C91|nr:hypothetical protein [Aerococcaceae bacterium zg-A91]MBS4458455.1 hypothetical protein [Aerococcaceae bacterium zg-BR33]
MKSEQMENKLDLIMNGVQPELKGKFESQLKHVERFMKNETVKHQRIEQLLQKIESVMETANMSQGALEALQQAKESSRCIIEITQQVSETIEELREPEQQSSQSYIQAVLLFEEKEKALTTEIRTFMTAFEKLVSESNLLKQFNECKHYK